MARLAGECQPWRHGSSGDWAGKQCGPVPEYRRKLAGLGLLEVDLPETGPGTLRGHTFHFSVTDTALPPIAHARRSVGNSSEALYRHHRLTASYMHFYFPSNPEATAQLFLG